MMGRQGMLRHEWIAVLFFAHIAAAALARRRMPPARRATAGIGAVLAAAGVIATARSASMAVRDWAPIASILAAYYLSGRTFFAPDPQVEAWLARIDRRILGDPAAAFSTWPAALVRILDAVYIGCFLLVPAGLALLLAAGHRGQSEQYWTIVAGAELGAFAALPYLQTRPPWVLERIAERRGGARRRASVVFMQRATTGANTLPSGHAAGSLAVALAVIGTLPVAGMVLLALALAISAAAVVTRAHFVVDIVTGIALAGIVWGLVRACGC
jgi:membrane-associated phospholipid phosphatase